MGPFFLLLVIATNILLGLENPFYRMILILQGIIMFCPIIDYIIRKIDIHIVLLRFITHFYSMNLALLAGFLKFVKGTETDVWQPTKRTYQ